MKYDVKGSANDEAEIRLGMSFDEVNKVTECMITVMDLISPADLNEGCIIKSNDIQVHVYFSDEDKLVSEISIHDPKYRLSNGLGVGSTLSAVKAAYKDYYIGKLPGYSTQLEVEGQVIFSFGWLERDIKEDDIVKWIELPYISVEQR